MVNSFLKLTAIWGVTAKAESWPVEPAQEFWWIWGTLEKRDRGSVVSWRRARECLGVCRE